MSSIVENINLQIKHVGYSITLNSLLEIVIREYTNLNITIKITKKFILLLENIVQFHNFGCVRLSKLTPNSEHYFISNELPHHEIIQYEENVYILNDMYLKLLNILIDKNISFDYDKIYIENRIKLIKSLTEENDNNVRMLLQNSCKYMEHTVLNYIGKINEIPDKFTINSSCTIGLLVNFYFKNNQ